MITYKTGNLLRDEAEVLVNTVNTVGVMGKGIALAFKSAFPHNFEVYREACRTGALKTGVLLPVKDSDLLWGEKIIINFPTKTHWRQPSAYQYVEQGLSALRDWLMTNQVRSIALPALGCGNGGLDWTRVRQMIEAHLHHLPLDIAVYLPA